MILRSVIRAVMRFGRPREVAAARERFRSVALAPFGYRMAWLAVRTEDHARLAGILGLESGQPVGWNEGLAAIYAEERPMRVLVSRPLESWCFVVGLALPYPAGPRFVDRCTPLLETLAGVFPDVQLYLTLPEFDLYAWARYRDGKLVRAYAAGDEGGIWSKGEVTIEEVAAGLEPGSGIDEDRVIALAARWSLDPTALEGPAQRPALVSLLRAPTRWRLAVAATPGRPKPGQKVQRPVLRPVA